VVLMLSGGTTLEEYATRRASAALDAMAKRMPTVAHRLQNSALSNVELNT
jgi:cation transport ATPase